ncbi:MAG: hypothetical protein LBV59_08825 [Sphingobacterium sp.]|uniref:hypothetical protein n=1 Tax=unclassified Sphingobacterium TaxID=2609468 RepID=UPI00283AD5F8|nr:hypothetical protein [Sphingobacterium sp.]MDR3008021.1 hypothetical protein [Sphingobacterium sp.]
MRFLNFLNGQSNLRQIDVSEDDDFVDLQLTITKYWKDDDEHHIVQAKGLWGRETVGLAIAFRPDMKLGIVDTEVDKQRFYREGINFYSIGKLSDNFTKALNSLFKIEGTSSKMHDTIGSTAFIVSGQPEYFDEEYIKAKVFFDDGNEKHHYAEWYVNIDLKHNILELREKDPEYRKNIISILTNV